MFKEEIGEEFAVSQSGTSEGTQVKYKKGDFWYKKDRMGAEGLVEYLVSRLLTFSNLKPREYVLYEQGTINGRPGCRSRDFLEEGDEFITFYRLYQNACGRDLSAVVNDFDTMEERIAYVVRYLKQSCDLDVTDYLSKVFTLDRLVLNEDRHFNNLGVIFRGDHFEVAPIFDNGISLMTASLSYNRHFSIAENVRRVTARPFCGSHERMYRYFGEGFRLDGRRALQWLLTEPQSKERDILAYQLHRYFDNRN